MVNVTQESRRREWYRNQIRAMVNRFADVSKAGNYTPGRTKKDGMGNRVEVPVNLVVIHLMDGTLGGTTSWFMNPRSDVSAHFGIGKDGELVQYVNLGDTAWHAGGSFGNNLRSVGIEHEGYSKDTDLWPLPMLEKSAQLTALLRLMFDISASEVRPHSDFNPAHACPGPRFDWGKYRLMVEGYRKEYESQALLIHPDAPKAPPPPPARPVAPVDPDNITIEMPLYTTGGVKVGGIAFRKGSGKAFLKLDYPTSYEQLQEVLRDMGYTRFKIDPVE